MVFIHNLNNMLYFYQYYDICNHISKKRGTVKCNWVK